jgi:enoyl-CoA hydratase/carnithine racemase
MEPARAMHLTAAGSTMSVFDAAEAGLIDHLVSAEALIDSAVRIAAAAKARPRTEPICISNARTDETRDALTAVRASLEATGSGRAVAAAVEAGLSGGWQAAIRSERDSLVNLRHTTEARSAIETFFSKSSAR